MKSFCLSFFLFTIFSANAQPTIYSAANAHSHNDYEQKLPFQTAYNEQFGSMEADIYLIDGNLLVSHEKKNADVNRTLENMYLQPIAENASKIKQLQLLIDFKTEGIQTMEVLITLLKKYPQITESKNIKLVISGNRPPEETWQTYPSYIWFDGTLGKVYTPIQLDKIGLLSESYYKFTTPHKPWPLELGDRDKIEKSIKKAHDLGKKTRLWAIPDFKECWEEMMKLQIDFINTDKINELSDYLISRNKTLRLLPYNRIIKSAGEVIRYGKPELENHALDVAVLDEKGLAVIEERYGLFVVDINQKKVISQWRYSDIPQYAKLMSTYSGIKTFKENDKNWIIWSASESNGNNPSMMIATWNNGIANISSVVLEQEKSDTKLIPNEIYVNSEKDGLAVYIVLNGSNKLIKLDWTTRKKVWEVETGIAPYGVVIANNQAYVSNWAGEVATDTTRERAGVPWGLAYTNPSTGATASGTVSVFNIENGVKIKDINVGLHPNAIISSLDQKLVYVSNGNSDDISVINTKSNQVIETIFVGLLRDKKSLLGSSPNGLELNKDNSILYVSNGLDNAIAVVELGKASASKGKGKSKVMGMIPTEAYPAGLKIINNTLVVANLESDGANVIDQKKKARSIHHELASVSIIPVPNKEILQLFTQEVSQLNLTNRIDLLSLAPRLYAKPLPVPERLGEPSVFKHVVYIIKENKTYDQVFGDIKTGKGDSSLCVFGEKITPNEHALAKQFGWMDEYYASGKSSAEGHQWTDAGMVSDYVEKNVRAWFRSYPHRQEDALVYNKSGFIWNQALDHGKTVRIFGEACETVYDRKLKWADLYERYTSNQKPDWRNTSTIARIHPIMSPTFPDCDNIAFSDQQRADIFIEEWDKYEKGDSLPNLMVMSLPNDHSAGTSPDFPTPNAMVADNDLALGRIVEMISKSKYWDSTVIFITQDDSQGGWDHISAYRTIGLVVSPYSNGKLVSTNFNQTSMLRTIEQILGIPPMNIMDATARLMTDCFQDKINRTTYVARPNNIPLNQMNKPLQSLTGKARKFALQSQEEVFNEVDGGKDDKMNRIIWYYSKGNTTYPRHSEQ